MERYNKIMQYVWLTVAVLGGAFAFYSFSILPEDQEPEYMVFMLPVVALILFYLRRRHNAALYKNNQNSNPEN